MNKSVKADVASFVKHLADAFKPIAKAEDIALSLISDRKPVWAYFQPAMLASDVSGILSKLIELTPEEEKITVILEQSDNHKCKVVLINAGINLTVNSEVINSCRLPVRVLGGQNETRFEIEVELFEEQRETMVDQNRLNGNNYIPDYYAEVRKRLRSHFIKSENLFENLFKTNPREAAFLNKINSAILANLENSQFDTNHLSELMNMSRTQLFRRLKPIIKESPGSYIRQIKLQKAKELFETTDLRISEVAYKTGFETASHFTKVFTKKYGVKPSLFCRKKENATNE